MEKAAFITKVNEWARDRVPFFFVCDFEMQKPGVWTLEEAAGEGIFFDFEGVANIATTVRPTVFVEKNPIAFSDYLPKFEFVKDQLQQGNSFLVNLTAKTEIHTGATLKEIFHASQARYRLLFRDEWVVFSPETFVRIESGSITTCPMKGTIDADLPEAEQMLLNDPKELAEHVTVVDLLRNDLSNFCTDVKVEKFRYVEHLRTMGKNLLQTSSRITGRLPHGYLHQLGDMLCGLLPAGSICGAPKPATCDIIRQAEGEERGFYTGVAGLFDGSTLNSCVMIRFIEKQGGCLFYRSGGGITAQSDARQEYEELINKVYVPAAGVYQNS